MKCAYCGQGCPEVNAHLASCADAPPFVRSEAENAVRLLGHLLRPPATNPPSGATPPGARPSKTPGQKTAPGPRPAPARAERTSRKGQGPTEAPASPGGDKEAAWACPRCPHGKEYHDTPTGACYFKGCPCWPGLNREASAHEATSVVGEIARRAKEEAPEDPFGV